MPLIPETYLADEHTNTMEEASFFQCLHTYADQADSHGASRCTPMCSWTPRHCALNSYMQAWLERKLVFYHGVPATHISLVAQHSFTTNFLPSGKFQARVLLVVPVARNPWQMFVPQYTYRCHHDRVVPASNRKKRKHVNQQESALKPKLKTSAKKRGFKMSYAVEQTMSMPGATAQSAQRGPLTATHSPETQSHNIRWLLAPLVTTRLASETSPDHLITRESEIIALDV